MIPSHYPEVLNEFRQRLPGLLAKEAMPEKNVKGVFTFGLCSEYRGLAVIGFLVERDVNIFRRGLIDATDCYLRLVDRFEAGDPISPGIFSMMAYKRLLDVLASGDIDKAKALASRMGGRPEIEKKYNRDFESAIGYALKAVLAGDDKIALARIDDLEKACNHRDYKNFLSYVPVLKSIVVRDSAALQAAFPGLLECQRRESKGRGMFSDLDDTYISVWGIGLLNLAKSRGLEVTVDDPLIPMELVM